MSVVLFDRQDRMTQLMHFDAADDNFFAIEEVEDVEAVIRDAKRYSDMTAGPADGLRLEAHVPDTVMNRSFREGWFHDQAAWRKWANDPDNRAFRIEYNGHVKRL